MSPDPTPAVSLNPAVSSNVKPSPPNAAPSPREVDGPAVVLWLMFVYAMILAMVVIGGTTRLTESGLSMVEWKPLIGAIPPLTDAEWNEMFRRYQEFPQYQKVNSWMDVHAFKEIFFWEYLHRLFGRLIGVVVFVPWLFFALTGRLSRRTSIGALIAIGLGGAQGLMGWYMVMSGLVDVPAVSHFRLAAHLILAFICSQWILWLLLNLRAPWKNVEGQGAVRTTRAGSPPLAGLGIPLALLSLLYVQIAYGAFVAGKRAGHMSSTFPDMNGHYLPAPFFTAATWVQNLFENPLSLHYLHRLLGTILLIFTVSVGVTLYRRADTFADKQLGAALVAMVCLQFALGVTTVVFHVPLGPAVVHQGGAMVLLGLVTALVHRALSRRPRVEVASKAEPQTAHFRDERATNV